MAGQLHKDAANRDGVPTCSICGSVRAPETVWCPLITALMCLPCCRRVRSLEPGAMVELLSLTDIALTPAEVMDGCSDCPVAAEDPIPIPGLAPGGSPGEPLPS